MNASPFSSVSGYTAVRQGRLPDGFVGLYLATATPVPTRSAMDYRRFIRRCRLAEARGWIGWRGIRNQEFQIENRTRSSAPLAGILAPPAVADSHTAKSLLPGSSCGGSMARWQWVRADLRPRHRGNGASPCAGNRRAPGHRRRAARAEQKFRQARVATSVGQSDAACFFQNPECRQHRTLLRTRASARHIASTKRPPQPSGAQEKVPQPNDFIS